MAERARSRRECVRVVAVERIGVPFGVSRVVGERGKGCAWERVLGEVALYPVVGEDE